jgi:peptidoglycan/LPS O-acetylase OafA/YrhL
VGSSRVRHLPGLDGLRGVAAFAVFVDHAEQYQDWLNVPNHYGPPFQMIGRQGVELFFVLSGFLITYLMFDERARNGRTDVKRFWIRRALRIWPLYYAALFVVFFVLPHVVPHLGPYVRDRSIGFVEGYGAPGDHRLALYAFMLPHVAFVFEPAVLCGTHLWSIGVEEQFYLFWPLLFTLFRRAPVRLFAAVIVASYVLNDVAFPWRDVVEHRFGWHTLDHLQHYADIAHVEAMAVGAMAAWLFFHHRPVVDALARDTWARVAAVLAIPAGVWVFAMWHYSMTPTWLYAFAIVVFAGGGASRLVDNAATRFLGRISYGFYVLHTVALFATAAIFEKAGILGPRIAYGPYAIAAFALAVGAAWASYRWLEGPFLLLKDRFASSAQVDARVVAAASEQPVTEP